MERLARAKINWDLRILGKRPDGFHELDTVMAGIELADRMTFEPAERLELTCSDPSLPCDDSNLVVKAARLLAGEARRPAGARIHLEKHVPAGGGLGGGSSDAATTLLALNELWELGWARERLAELAARLGSDIAYFLWGGWCQCTGRGERVAPLLGPPISEKLTIFLVIPSFGVPTPAVYRKLQAPAWDSSKQGRALTEVSDNIRMQITRHYRNASLLDGCRNDLREAACAAEPRLAALEARLDELASERWRLSGSGAVHFVIGSSQGRDSEMERTLRKGLPPDVRILRTQTA
ncbi:MAG: 4-(cytidine 5'-diphospho)-2-C-methyl-D-erythritol kinase [Planctomycetota bacterium]|nr:4-(cytidine 5'-diphospho)-2-C-methyl-D-erythritol kinase [Planctomycetota bacterium]